MIEGGLKRQKEFVNGLFETKKVEPLVPDNGEFVLNDATNCRTRLKAFSFLDCFLFSLWIIFLLPEEFHIGWSWMVG